VGLNFKVGFLTEITIADAIIIVKLHGYAKSHRILSTINIHQDIRSIGRGQSCFTHYLLLMTDTSKLEYLNKYTDQILTETTDYDSDSQLKKCAYASQECDSSFLQMMKV
jgi:hypothetical protein